MLLRLWRQDIVRLAWRKVRCLQTTISTTRELHAERQQHRGLVRVEGEEAADFLQGLITNDMKHLEDSTSGMFCLMLNRQGRVLYDSIIYHHSPNSFLVECDAPRANQLVRHLRMYKVRRRLSVDDATQELSVWCVFDPEPDMKEEPQVDAESIYLNPQTRNESVLKLAGDFRNVMVVPDPRVRLLGHRLVVPASVASLRDFIPDVEEDKGNEKFKHLRYRLGVGEGPEELPPTKCLPLEANCDYLHGVSFHKGCYVGQELTARTFHTGVVRKRLLPLCFSENASKVEPDTSVLNEKGRAVGKVRACQGRYGLGLLRVEECLSAKRLTVGDFTVETFRPPWWPLQAPKSKANQ